MSLKVKCNKCGFLLDFDIRTPGLIVVNPCEGCVQQVEDVGETVVAGEASGLSKFMEQPDMLGRGNKLTELGDRINTHNQQEDGADDGNNWRPVKER